MYIPLHAKVLTCPHLDLLYIIGHDTVFVWHCLKTVFAVLVCVCLRVRVCVCVCVCQVQVNITPGPA